MEKKETAILLRAPMKILHYFTNYHTFIRPVNYKKEKRNQIYIYIAQ